ncbi:hypothetical protein [Streptomyces cyaneofuscatus]
MTRALPVQSRTDELVRAAMGHPSWRHVGQETREALNDLYAAVAPGPGPGQALSAARQVRFEAELTALVDADSVLSLLVSEAARALPDGTRTVLPVSGRHPEPVRWACPDPGCTRPPVGGEYDGPFGPTTCAKHPHLLLRRLS